MINIILVECSALDGTMDRFFAQVFLCFTFSIMEQTT